MAGPSDLAQVIHGPGAAVLEVNHWTVFEEPCPQHLHPNAGCLELSPTRNEKVNRCRQSWDFLPRVAALRTCQSSRSYGYFAALYRVVPEAPHLHLAASCCLVLLPLPSPGSLPPGASKYNYSSSTRGRGGHRSWFARHHCNCQLPKLPKLQQIIPR